MNQLSCLFFELIQVSDGTQESLSRLPSAAEWGELYKLAKKQSLLGVCFSGLQRMGADADEGFARIGMSEMLYLTWMGKAAKIQHRNEIVTQQCVELQERLRKEGFNTCILKGQGVAQLYGEELKLLRQSGDIDVWVDAPKEKIIAWAKKVGVTEHASYLHVGARCFKDTGVELHYRPSYMYSLSHNKRLQAFCAEHKEDWKMVNGLTVPSWEFNVVFMLSHMYRHLFGSGIGLRQLMDYYFVLRAADEGQRTKDEGLVQALKHLGLYDFAGAVMYVMREVFIGNNNENLLRSIKPDEKRGKMLLDMVMQTGNFGKMDDIQKEARRTTAGKLKYKLNLWCKLIRFYPEETLSASNWSLVSKLGIF